MHTYFHGWRRKAGVVSLVMACLLCGMWVRSRIVGDGLLFQYLGKQRYFASAYGRIIWWSDDNIFPFDYSLGGPLPAVHSVFEESQFTMPYWSLVVPLTLLSAYLLLVPSRKQQPTASQHHA